MTFALVVPAGNVEPSRANRTRPVLPPPVFMLPTEPKLLAGKPVLVNASASGGIVTAQADEAASMAAKNRNE